MLQNVGLQAREMSQKGKLFFLTVLLYSSSFREHAKYSDQAAAASYEQQPSAHWEKEQRST